MKKLLFALTFVLSASIAGAQTTTPSKATSKAGEKKEQCKPGAKCCKKDAKGGASCCDKTAKATTKSTKG